MNPYTLETVLNGYSVRIECETEAMARNMLAYFTRIEPQFTVVRENATNTAIVSFGPRVVCACDVCRRDIYDGDAMADHKVFKCGELSYIALAHKDCAIADNVARNSNFWEYD